VIWLEPAGVRLRWIDGDPTDRPPYRTFGTMAFHRDIAVLDGLHGRVRPKEVVEFYRLLRARFKMRWLVAERTGRHRIPFATQIECGPFAGWWAVDLTRFDKEEGHD